jgi:DNA-binding transcriptional LysR family regulator
MFDLRDMELLVALERHRHFARAAEACGISQPAFSARIRNLEIELSASIVQRGNRFQGFTPEGEIALRWARRLLLDAESLKEEIDSAKGSVTGRLAIGVVPTALTFVAKVPGLLREKHPDLRVEILSYSSTAIRQRLENFSLGAGVTYLTQSYPDTIRQVRLYEERYVLLAPRSMIADATEISWAEAGELPLCLLTRAMQNRRILDEVFASVGILPRPILETNAFTAALAQVATGAAATIAPERLAASLPKGEDIVELPLIQPEISRPVGLVVQASTPGQQALATLEEVLASLC